MIRMREQAYSEGLCRHFSVHHIKGCVMSVCLVAGSVNFNHLIKWFSGLLHCKMTVSPLLTNTLFKEDNLKLYKYPHSPLTLFNNFSIYQWVVVQLLSHVWLFATPWTAASQASLSFTISQSFLKLISIELMMPSNHLILCHPLFLPSIFPSIRIFSHESVLCIRWPKIWSFSFSISPSSEYSGLISYRTDWLDLLAVQGTLKSLLQHHSWKASILQCSAILMAQLS